MSDTAVYASAVDWFSPNPSILHASDLFLVIKVNIGWQVLQTCIYLKFCGDTLYVFLLYAIHWASATFHNTHPTRTGCFHHRCVCVIYDEVWNKSFSGTTGLFTRHSLQCYRNTCYAQVL